IKKKYREQGFSTKQIAAILSGATLPVEEEKSDYELLAERLDKQDRALAEILRMQQEQNEMIERSIKARDEQIILTLREFREKKQPKSLVDKLLSRFKRKNSF